MPNGSTPKRSLLINLPFLYRFVTPLKREAETLASITVGFARICVSLPRCATPQSTVVANVLGILFSGKAVDEQLAR